MNIVIAGHVGHGKSTVIYDDLIGGGNLSNIVNDVKLDETYNLGAQGNTILMQ